MKEGRKKTRNRSGKERMKNQAYYWTDGNK